MWRSSWHWGGSYADTETSFELLPLALMGCRSLQSPTVELKLFLNVSHVVFSGFQCHSWATVCGAFTKRRVRFRLSVKSWRFTCLCVWYELASFEKRPFLVSLSVLVPSFSSNAAFFSCKLLKQQQVWACRLWTSPLGKGNWMGKNKNV